MWLSLISTVFLLKAVASEISAPANISDFNLTIFDQFIDHSNPSLGTFKQRVWSNARYWKGPGSPVVMNTPGHDDASTYPEYLTNKKISGAFAEAIGGAVVMIEHRYFGESSPYDSLTVENLKYLDLNNSLLDFVNIAKNIQLPFDPKNSSQADVAPWIYTGGSYAGSLAVWTQNLYPGTYWAYYASSAPVQNSYYFWQYFEPIRQGMPKNCSKDVNLVMNYVDSAMESGDQANITALKTMFGAQTFEHDDDFLSLFLYGPFIYQNIGFQYYLGYTAFDKWCDYIETGAANSGDPIPGEEGVGLEKALAGYAKWMTDVQIPGTCANYGYPEWSSTDELACLNTHNASSPMYKDLRVNNGNTRQWQWLACSLYGNNQAQDMAPSDIPVIVPRSLGVEYFVNQCNLMFPPENGFYYNEDYQKANNSADIFQEQLNRRNNYTFGWDIEGRTKRTVLVNGEFDPWLPLSVSSPYRPGGAIKSTSEQPIFIVEGGIHTSDMDMPNALWNDAIGAVQNKTIAQMKAWVEDYYKK